MASFIQNILWNSVEGFVEAGTRTAGGYAGDALIKAGDLIESGGRGVGNRLERAASGYGDKITGQGYQPSGKALPPTAKKAAVKRSNSSPAAMKAKGPTSSTPVGAKKYPGGYTAPKALPSSTTGSKPGGAQKAITAKKELPKPYPNNAPYGTSTTPSSIANKPKPKQGPGSTTSYPTEKKTAVKPGQPKPFQAPGAKGGKETEEKKPYPGTNTYPGQASKKPVKRYQGLERMKPPVEKGKAVHIGAG